MPTTAPASPPDVVEHVLPQGEVSILAGSSGAGKTTLIMQLLAAFQAGETHFLGCELDLNQKWGYIANDHAWKMYEGTAERCKLSVKEEDLPHIALMDDDEVDLEMFRVNALLVLETCLKRLIAKGCTVICVDTLVSFFGSDTKAYNQNAYALLRLGRFCRKHNITILGTHHTTKARTDYGFKRPQDRISGSSSLLGFSSTQLCLIPPDETGEATSQFHIIAHNAAARMIPLVRDVENAGTFKPFDASTVAGVDGGALEVLTVVKDAGDTVSVPRGYLAESLKAKMSTSTLDRHLRDLVATGQLSKSKHGEYRVPEVGTV